MKRMPLIAATLVAALGLGACSSTQDVLEPSAIAASPPAAGVLHDEMQPGIAPSASAATASLATGNANPGVATTTRLRFDPVVGPTATAATPLSEQLAKRATEHGITLASSSGQAATHIVKGYFSVLDENGATTVIFVWDVYDASGNRLHRINGQQKASGGRGEGWPAVSPKTMRSIADSSVDQLISWLASGTG